MRFLSYSDLEAAAHPVIIATNGELSLNSSKAQKAVWKELVQYFFSIFPYVCLMDSAILGVLAKVYNLGISFIFIRNFKVELWFQ